MSVNNKGMELIKICDMWSEHFKLYKKTWLYIYIP